MKYKQIVLGTVTLTEKMNWLISVFFMFHTTFNCIDILSFR